MPKFQVIRKGGTIRLTLPSNIANDLGVLQRSLKLVAERLGHPTCATGCDILHIGLEQELAFNEKVELNPQPLPPSSAIDLQARGLITVSIPDKVNNDIEALTRSIGNVVGKLGCAPCCSGFDILFRREINMMALNEKGEVARFGGLG